MYSVEQPPASRVVAPLDVIVLVAPSRRSRRAQFLHTIIELKAARRAAILVVFPHIVDAEVLARTATAGADLCVVAPTPDELFLHIERARFLHRTASHERSTSTRRQNCRRSDEILGTLWRKRSQRKSPGIATT